MSLFQHWPQKKYQKNAKKVFDVFFLKKLPRIKAVCFWFILLANAFKIIGPVQVILHMIVVEEAGLITCSVSVTLKPP